MASNVYLTSNPPQLWNSAYSDIKFVFDFTEYTIINISEQIVSSVGTGYAEFTISQDWDFNPIKNEYINITSGAYNGLYRVLSSSNNKVVLNVQYTTSLPINTVIKLKHLRLPVFSLYKGFKNSEQFINELPYTLVTSFTYTFSSNYQIEINVKGLVQKIFEIKPPVLTQDYDFSVFNAIRLEWDGEETVFFLILNSSISTNELNAKYVTGALELSNVNKSLIWGCGNTFNTLFENGYPKLYIYNGEEQVTVGFSNAFQTNQFNQGFDIN